MNLPVPIDSRSNYAVLKELVALAALHYDTTEEDIMSARRDRHIYRARRFCQWAAKNLTSLSLPEIGRFFDRDHTTILHACRSFSDSVKDGREKVPAFYLNIKKGRRTGDFISHQAHMQQSMDDALRVVLQRFDLACRRDPTGTMKAFAGFVEGLNSEGLQGG